LFSARDAHAPSARPQGTVIGVAAVGALVPQEFSADTLMA
jgi:hypothetical protein